MFPRWGTHIIRDMCFPGGGTHIIRDMCFPGGGTHITRDTCFPGGGTHITRDMCFPGGGTHITRDMCFLGGGTHITRVKPFAVLTFPSPLPSSLLKLPSNFINFSLLFLNHRFGRSVPFLTSKLTWDLRDS